MSQHFNDIALHRPKQLVEFEPLPGTTRGARESRTGGAGAAPGTHQEGTMSDRHAAPEVVIAKVCAAHQRRTAVTLDYDEICGLLNLILQRTDAADRAKIDAEHYRTRLDIAKSEVILKVAAARDVAGELRRVLVQILRAHGKTLVTGQPTFRDHELVEDALGVVAGAAELLQPLPEVDVARLADLHTLILTEDRS